MIVNEAEEKLPFNDGTYAIEVILLKVSNTDSNTNKVDSITNVCENSYIKAQVDTYTTTLNLGT